MVMWVLRQRYNHLNTGLLFRHTLLFEICILDVLISGVWYSNCTWAPTVVGIIVIAICSATIWKWAIWNPTFKKSYFEWSDFRSPFYEMGERLVHFIYKTIVNFDTKWSMQAKTFIKIRGKLPLQFNVFCRWLIWMFRQFASALCVSLSTFWCGTVSQLLSPQTIRQLTTMMMQNLTTDCRPCHNRYH